MDIRKLQRAIVDGLEDVKAQHIVVFNTEALSPLFERVIIASGTSNRQTKALASSVRESVKSRGMQVMRTEGEDNGEWIIVDCGAAVAHIMQPAIREYYHLEEIWGAKPIKLKAGAAASRPAGLPKASEPAAPAKAGATKKAAKAAPVPAKRAPAQKAATQKVPAKNAPAKKAPANKVPASERATAGRVRAAKTTVTTGTTASTATSATRRSPAAKPAVPPRRKA